MSKPDIFAPDETITPEGLEVKRNEIRTLLESLDHYGPRPDATKDSYVDELYQERGSDLLADFMHACRVEGIAFDELLDRAQRDFEAETSEADAPTL